jgi:D-alanyl-D-alanine carboxypeptidase (penicillin-binding protein 5/6)
MSRELLLNHPKIHDYCTIWMENIIHNTARGSSEFGLSNTNKLLKQYEYATGLKTGYTSTAGFCVSASAQKDGIELIAVIMGGSDSKSRFQDAMTLLNTGFQNVSLYRDEDRPSLPDLPVEGGVEEQVSLVYGADFSYVDTEGNHLADIQKEMQLPESLEAPVEEGMEVGSIRYLLSGKEIGTVSIQAAASVARAGFPDVLQKAFESFLL